MLINSALFMFAYLMGSISSAIFVCKAFKLPDPRTKGSNNPGATNVMRIGGKLPAIITLICDVLKGVLPVLLAQFLYKNSLTVSFIVLFAFLGHVYPLFFNFKGGKGVATALGGLLAMSYMVGLLFITAWLLIFVSTRISSLSALFATILTPIFTYLFIGLIPSAPIFLMCLLLLYNHRENIKRLLSKQEKQIS